MNQRRLKAARGLLLIVAALFVLGIANSPFAATYPALLHLELGPAIPRVGAFSLHEWIPDGLIAIFFLFVGLVVKREWHEGILSTAEARRLFRNVALAAAAAVIGFMALMELLGFRNLWPFSWNRVKLSDFPGSPLCRFRTEQGSELPKPSHVNWSRQSKPQNSRLAPQVRGVEQA